jgi:hypothetical protein
MVMAESTLTQQPQVAEHPAAPNVAEDSEKPRGLGNLLLRIVLATATTLVSINLWSGGPLLALWVGSRIQTAVGSLSMAAIGATLGVLIVETFLLYRLLAWLSTRYDAAIGRKVRRVQAPWLKPMSGERRTLAVRRPLTAVERIVVISVVAAFEAALIWFFFFAHYSLPG